MLNKIKWWFEDRVDDLKPVCKQIKDKTVEKIESISLENIIEAVKKWWTFKNNRKVLFAVLGLYGLIITLMISYENVNKKQEVIDKWYEQLDGTDWMKEEITAMLTTETLKMTTWVEHLFTGANSGIGEEAGEFSKVLDGITENIENQHRSEFVLRYANGDEEVKTIKLEPGESVELNFFHENELQEFDITQEEALTMSNLFVVSCTDDTSIAIINDGVVTARNKGKTVLYIYCNGFLFEYPIKVK